MTIIERIDSEIEILKDLKRAESNKWFFKTGPGQYGEGDEFVGLTLPQIRYLSKKYKDITLLEIIKLLHSPIHEKRLLSLIILVQKFVNGTNEEKEKIYKLYLENTKFINNWDLVDVSCPKIVGQYLENRDRKILLTLAKSKLLWDRRIAIVSTLYFIVKQKSYHDTFLISEALLTSRDDLIHKAMGWMLREVGKNCGLNILEGFLKKHARTMPRTALRYSLEKMDVKKESILWN